MTDGPRKPPPPPPPMRPRPPGPPPAGAPRPPPPPPIPARGQPISQEHKDSIAEMALGLLEEQVQAPTVHYLLVRYQNRMQNELAGFDYASDEVKDRANETLARFTKEMQDGFLSRRSSELKRIVSVFNGVMVDFFAKQIAPNVGDLSREV